MTDKLNIRQVNRKDKVVLHVSGRLDANWAGHLDDYLSNLIREKQYKVDLDLSEVFYLSSGGIRILLKQNKAFRKVMGGLTISNPSENVSSVLEMVGMSSIFSSSLHTEEKESTKQQHSFERHGYTFVVKKDMDNPPAKAKSFGNPKLMLDCSYTEENNHAIKIEKPEFGIGIGALGSDFNDFKNRYGEYISLGEVFCYRPSDGNYTPDFMIKKGSLTPEMNALYGIQINNNFQKEIEFSSQNQNQISIALGDLVEAIAEEFNLETFGMLFIGESNGLIGSGLNVAPVKKESPFHFPHVRERMMFTTEPAYLDKLTINFGIISKQENHQLNVYLRPLYEGSKFQAHFHSVVFPYTALRQKNTDHIQSINYLFENTTAIDVLHLIDDCRKINGLGQSTYKSGYCWLTKIESN